MAKTKQHLPEEVRNAVRAEYEAGLVPVEEIAKRHGLTTIKVMAWVAAHRWKRKQLSDSLREEAVTQNAHRIAGSTAQTDADVVKVYGSLAAEVMGRHQAVAGRSRTLVEKLIADIEQSHREMADFMADDRNFTKDVVKDKKRTTVQLTGAELVHARAIKRSGVAARLTDTLKDLTGALEKLVAMERKAWNLDEVAKPLDYESLLD